MRFKMFSENDSRQSVSINPENVKYVRETPQGVKVVFIDNSYVFVSDSYLDTVARLNEK